MRTQYGPDDGVPTFGFRELTFTPKAPCQVCSRKVYVGLVNIANDDPKAEGFKVVCRRCAAKWDDGA